MLTLLTCAFWVRPYTALCAALPLCAGVAWRLRTSRSQLALLMIAAALASARRGAETWLVEASSFVGGLATLGLINLLLTLDDGDGHQVVAGLCQEFVDRLEAQGQARYPPKEQWGLEDAGLVDHWRRWGLVWGAPPEAVRYSVAFDPEAFIDVAYETLAAAGVHLRLHTWCGLAAVATA